jgi:rhodanese-related sulfurtransferase
MGETCVIRALVIAAVTVPSGGILGLTHCPGRGGHANTGRSLAADLAAIEAWGASILISLTEAAEFADLGVPDFMPAAKTRSFQWHHAPIPDMQTPGAEFRAAWQTTGPAVAAALGLGKRIAVHCAAGLGRSGTVAAKLLVDCGMSADAAIAHVRACRPGAIETTAQEHYVRTAASLLGSRVS